MQIRSFTTGAALLMALSMLVVLSGCGDNDDNSSGQQSSLVQGNVAQVMTAMEELEIEPIQLSRWKEFFSFVATAHAQGTDLSGITVIAQLNGVTLDTAVTDAAGNFTLNVPGGELMLVFVTEAYELTLTLTVPEGSNVSLTVSLQPEDTETPVVVEQMDVAYQPIFCTSETMTLSGDSDYVIDGGGDACIRATGKCMIESEFEGPVNIRLVNCSHCIRAEGQASIHLMTEGSIACEDALEDGIHSRGRADIDVQAGEMITVSAVEDGIDASGNSSVHLSLLPVEQGDDQGEDQGDNQGGDQEPTAPISVMGAVGVHAQGNATVEIDGDCLVEGTTESLSQSGNASVTTTCDL